MHLSAGAWQDVIIAIVAVGGTALYYFGRIPKQTLTNLQITIDSYVKLDASRQKEIELLKVEVHENNQAHTAEVLQLNKSISNLEGQVTIYKELPLKELADGIAQLNIKQSEMLVAIKANGTIAGKDAKIAQADTDQVAKTLRNK